MACRDQGPCGPLCHKQALDRARLHPLGDCAYRGDHSHPSPAWLLPPYSQHRLCSSGLGPVSRKYIFRLSCTVRVTDSLSLVRQENGSAVFTKKRVPAPLLRLFINFQRWEPSSCILLEAESAYEYSFYYYAGDLALRVVTH